LEDLANKEGSSDDSVRGKFTVEGLHYSQDKLGCPVKTGTYENLNYLALNQFTATESGEPIGLRVEGE
jgi:hypothetical protein